MRIRIKKYYCLLLFLFIVSVQSVQAQWVRVNGPYGFTVASLNAAGDNLFLSTSGDNYISADIGKSWRRLNSGISGQIKSVVGIGTNLFAGTKKGVFHSTDNGMTWDSASSGFPQFVPVNTLAVIGTKLFAGTGDVGGGGYAGNAYISNDYGKSWTLLHSWGSVNCLVAVGSTLFAGTGDFMYGMGAGEGGLFISRDNGVTWTDSGLHGIGTNNSVFFDGGYLFVHMTTYSSDHGYGSQLYISADSGKTWNNFNSSIMPLAAGPDGKGGMNLYGGSKGVFLSNNNGIDWTSIGLNNITVKSLAVIGTNLFAAFDKGIYYSYDFGGTWNLINIKISALDIRFIAADSTNRLAVTTGNAIYLSTDGGASWDSTIAPNLGTIAYSHLAFDGAALYARSIEGEFFVTTDNGNNWVKKIGNIDPNIGGVSDTSVNSFVVVNNKLFASISYRLPDHSLSNKFLVSTDYGTNWISTGLPDEQYLSLGYSKNKLYGVMAYSTVFLSTDEGASWQDLGYPKYYAIYCLALAGTNLIAGTSGNGILVTDINEPGWKQTALKYGTVNSLAVSGGDIFEGSLNNGVERSSDNGMNWIEINDGLTNLSVNSLVISGEYLYAGTSGSGIWKRPLSEITSAENNSNTLPSKFSLDQNYPNPFNPSTTISYSVPFQSEVSISIYNSLGVLIKVLVNRAESAGLHRVIFNADNLASGVYFYKLTARGINDNSITRSVRKMLLLK